MIGYPALIESPPIRNTRELDTAIADDVRRHICWELKRLVAEFKTSQLDVALAIGYQSSGGAFSRYINGREALPLDRARRLDEAYPSFALALESHTFLSLRELESAKRRGAVPVATDYDVFLAAPMSAAAGNDPGDDVYWQARDNAMEVAATLEHFCDFRVYYAGRQIEKSEHFDSSSISSEEIRIALGRARFFVLLALSLPDKASSIFVEAGMALALDKPSMFFVSHPLEFPWILREIGGHRSDVLPRCSVEYVRTVADVTGRLRRHRAKLFTRLEEAT